MVTQLSPLESIDGIATFPGYCRSRIATLGNRAYAIGLMQSIADGMPGSELLERHLGNVLDLQLDIGALPRKHRVAAVQYVDQCYETGKLSSAPTGTLQ
jgi:hypothetical protein